MGEEMEGFWAFAGFGTLIFLILVGAGINVYLRAKAGLYARLKTVTIESQSKKEDS